MLGRYRGKREAPKPEKRSEVQTDGLDLEEALGQGGAGGAEDRDILPVGKQPRRKLGAPLRPDAGKPRKREKKTCNFPEKTIYYLGFESF